MAVKPGMCACRRIAHERLWQRLPAILRRGARRARARCAAPFDQRVAVLQWPATRAGVFAHGLLRGLLSPAVDRGNLATQSRELRATAGPASARRAVRVLRHLASGGAVQRIEPWSLFSAL